MDNLRTKMIKIKDWQLFLLFIFLSIFSTIVIIKTVHNSRDVMNIWVFLLKLVPFVFALLGIVHLPSWFKRPWDLLLILFSFCIFLAFFMAKISYTVHQANNLEYYLLIQPLVPYIILSLVFAYKAGGGKKKDTLILGIILLIFMLSGVEDVAYFLVNPHHGSLSQALPETWDWTSHITVRVGRVIHKYEIFIFMGAHFLLILLIIYFSYFHKRLMVDPGNVKKLSEAEKEKYNG